MTTRTESRENHTRIAEMERLENVVKAADRLCFDKEIAGDITFKSESARRAFVELCQAVVAVYRDGATNWNEVVQILQR